MFAGYTNFLLAHVMTEHECHAGTQLVQAYRRFVLSGAGLLAGPLAEGRKPVDADTGNLLPVVVTFVSRRPYSAHGIDHPFMGRQIDNEEAVMEAMSSFGAHRVAVKRVDFAGMDVQEQLRTAANTEIMVSDFRFWACGRAPSEIVADARPGHPPSIACRSQCTARR